MKNESEKYMNKALALAAKAETLDEVPVGAVIVKDGQIIGRGWNRRQQKQNALEHAEIMAIAQACRKLKSWRLESCTLYVTLEPCPMCAGAIIQSRIANVIFGAYDPKGGACGSVINLFEIPQWNHHPNWEGGILEAQCSKQLKDYFRKKRAEKKAQKIARKAAQNQIQSTDNSTPPVVPGRSASEAEQVSSMQESEVGDDSLSDNDHNFDLERVPRTSKGD